jgi:hypothetical protein
VSCLRGYQQPRQHSSTQHRDADWNKHRYHQRDQLNPAKLNQDHVDGAIAANDIVEAIGKTGTLQSGGSTKGVAQRAAKTAGFQDD